ALEVLQEASAEAGPPAGPRDEPGDIGDEEALPLAGIIAGKSHHTQVRYQRGERVVGHFGRGSRHCADESAFADIGKPQDTYIGQDLELEAKVLGFARLSRFGPARRAIVGCGEMDVPPAALAAVCDDLALSGLGDVEASSAALCVEALGPHRNADLEVLAAPPVAVLAHPMLASFGAERVLMDQV